MSYDSQEVVTYARDPTAVVWHKDGGSGNCPLLNFCILCPSQGELSNAHQGVS